MKVGVEIEGVKQKGKKVFPYSYSLENRRNWVLKIDNSVKGGYELVSPPYQRIKILKKKLEEKINEKELELFFSINNGIHVHITFFSLTPLFFYFISSFYIFFIEKKIKGLLLKSLTNINEYSRVVFNRNIYKLNSFQLNLLTVFYQKTNIVNRYIDFNYNEKYGTVECRNFILSDIEKIGSFLDFLKEKEEELKKLLKLSKDREKIKKEMYKNFYNNLIREKKEWNLLLNKNLIEFFELEEEIKEIEEKLSIDEVEEKAKEKIKEIINNINTNLEMMKEKSFLDINIFDLFIFKEEREKIKEILNNNDCYKLKGKEIKEIIQ